MLTTNELQQDKRSKRFKYSAKCYQKHWWKQIWKKYSARTDVGKKLNKCNNKNETKVCQEKTVDDTKANQNFTELKSTNAEKKDANPEKNNKRNNKYY